MHLACGVVPRQLFVARECHVPAELLGPLDCEFGPLMEDDVVCEVQYGVTLHPSLGAPGLAYLPRYLLRAVVNEDCRVGFGLAHLARDGPVHRGVLVET